MSSAGGQLRLNLGHDVLLGWAPLWPGLRLDGLRVFAALLLFLLAARLPVCSPVGGVAFGLGFVGSWTALLDAVGWQRLRYSFCQGHAQIKMREGKIGFD